MFTQNTVFILGAGSSWHYGYPTGEDLVKKVISKAKALASFCETSGSLKNHDPNTDFPKTRDIPERVTFQTVHDFWKAYENDFKQLCAKLEQVQPLVIDYFLEQNPTVREIGKFLIAWVILECENHKSNINRVQKDRHLAKDNWYRFILNQISSRASLSKDLHHNKVSFVTFNYDRSLENQLYEGLMQIDLFDEQDIKTFIEENIHHAYGRVGDLYTNDEANFAQNPGTYSHNSTKNFRLWHKHLFETAHNAAKKIRTINGNEKDNDEVFQKSKHLISQAYNVYILGYGFDPENNRRLNLNRLLKEKHHSKHVFFTNFRDSNIVNKRASHLFWGHDDHKTSFVPPNPMIHGNFRQPPYFEKSIKTVYEAFEQDFDLAA